MSYIVRSILFVLFGSFAGLAREDQSLHHVLVRVNLPLGLSGVFPLPMVLGRTAEGLNPLMTVTHSRNWVEQLQSWLLRPSFGPEAIRAYQRVLAQERKELRQKFFGMLLGALDHTDLSERERYHLRGALREEILPTDRWTAAHQQLLSPLVAGPEELETWWTNR
jgi:hypothetical protein